MEGVAHPFSELSGGGSKIFECKTPLKFKEEERFSRDFTSETASRMSLPNPRWGTGTHQRVQTVLKKHGSPPKWAPL